MNLKKYLYHLAVAFDQLGNAVAGGNPDCTISARIGYNVHGSDTPSNFWAVLEVIVNWTFRPIDGPNHCLQAYTGDKDEDFYTAGKDWIKVVLLAIVLAFCAPISIILRISTLFKKRDV